MLLKIQKIVLLIDEKICLNQINFIGSKIFFLCVFALQDKVYLTFLHVQLSR